MATLREPEIVTLFTLALYSMVETVAAADLNKKPDCYSRRLPLLYTPWLELWRLLTFIKCQTACQTAFGHLKRARVTPAVYPLLYTPWLELWRLPTFIKCQTACQTAFGHLKRAENRNFLTIPVHSGTKLDLFGDFGLFFVPLCRKSKLFDNTSSQWKGN